MVAFTRCASVSERDRELRERTMNALEPLKLPSPLVRSLAV
jgi:hypothetical protein